jgi:hypothetical protein
MLSGVIEGFYGPPWSETERTQLFEWMSAWGLNTYLYCPKDDLHHRAIWREPYGEVDADALGQVIAACRAHGIRFVYGLGPGLDIRYSDETEMLRLQERFTQLLSLGCDDFALLFDDIPDRLDADDLTRWGSLAAAQATVANALCTWVRQQRPDALFAFCPTPYCGRMAAAGHGGEGFLETLGEWLLPDIDVFWTGPEIVSAEITVEHVRDLQRVLRRKPIIWDNLHANDYDSRRMLLGPYSGRPPALRSEVRGILTNPNTEFWLNYPALRTFAQFTSVAGDTWDARAAYLSAIEEWLPSFATVHGPLDLDEVLQLCDCFYLPYEDGPRANTLCAAARDALTDSADGWRDQAADARDTLARLRDTCARLSTLRHRPLFHALNRRVWDLREELDLVVRGITARLDRARVDGPAPVNALSFHSDAHLPGTYRGGMVARLQQLLTPQADGSFSAAGGGVPR